MILIVQSDHDGCLGKRDHGNKHGVPSLIFGWFAEQLAIGLVR